MQPQGLRRKSVTFDVALECYPLRAGAADAASEFWQTHALAGEQDFDSDVSMDSSAAALPEDSQGRAASTVSNDADGSSGAQEDEDDDVSLAEIEAYADEQASRFMPLIEKRRARRTATVSIGRARQVDGISFQVKASALWQRRDPAEKGPGAAQGPSVVYVAL